VRLRPASNQQQQISRPATGVARFCAAWTSTLTLAQKVLQL
jgi:hypothetical protein